MDRSLSPFFVASDMSYAVQAADVCMYCVNWGFRLDAIGMNGTSRPKSQLSVRGLTGFSSTDKAIAKAMFPRASESFMCPIPRRKVGAQEKRGNAVGATLKPLLKLSLHIKYR